MSKIELKSVYSTSKPVPKPNFTVGSIASSSSGFDYPIYIGDIDTLDSYFGDADEYSSHANLIKQGISLYLMPTLSRSSQYSRSSIRFCENLNIKCHPRINYDYTSEVNFNSENEEKFKQVGESKLTFLYKLDFSRVTAKSLIGTYVVIPVHDSSSIALTDNKGLRLAIAFTDTPGYLEAQPAGEDYDLGIIQIVVQEDQPLESILTDIVTKVGELGLNSALELPKNIVEKFCQDNSLDPRIPEQLKALKELSYQMDFGSITDKEAIKWLDHLSDPTNIEPPKTDHIRVSSNSAFDLNNFKQRSGQFYSFESALEFHFQTNSNELSAFPLWIDEDVLCCMTDSIKTVEFFSKIRGILGSCISLEITKLSSNVYNIRITNGLISEEFDVRLDSSPRELPHISQLSQLSTLVDVRVYDYQHNGNLACNVDLNYDEVEFDESNYRDLTQVGLPEGIFRLERSIVGAVDHEDYIYSLDLFRTSRVYPDLFIVPTLPHADCIEPLNQLVWDNSNLSDFDESIFSQVLINLNFSDIQSDTLNKLQSKENRVLYFLGNIYSSAHTFPLAVIYAQNIRTQSLFDYPAISYRYTELNRESGSMITLGTAENFKSQYITRIFNEGDSQYLITVDADYKIHYGVIKSKKYYELTQEEFNNPTPVISSTGVDILDLQSLCDKYYINYPKFNNLDYYFDQIKEIPNQGNNFILRSIESKYTRSVYSIATQLRGSKLTEILGKISVINQNCLNYFPLIESSEYTHHLSTNGSELMVAFTIKIKKLVNKTFKVIININI